MGCEFFAYILYIYIGCKYVYDDDDDDNDYDDDYYYYFNIANTYTQLYIFFYM